MLFVKIWNLFFVRIVFIFVVRPAWLNFYQTTNVEMSCLPIINERQMIKNAFYAIGYQKAHQTVFIWR